MQLNIVGTVTRTRLIELFPSSSHHGCSTAEYAQVQNNDTNIITMLYKEKALDNFVKDSPKIWLYLSFAGLWMGSSDDISKKKLLKVID